MNDFDALLSELGTLSKSMQTSGDVKVQAAAKEAGAVLPAGEEDADGKDDEKDDELFGKSFQVTMQDGSVQEAFDGTAMMKSLAGTVSGLQADAAVTSGELAKALTFAATVTGIVAQQGELIKSLRADLAAVSTQGRGRTAALTVMDKPGATAAPVAAAQPAGIMAKAMTAFNAGTFSGAEVARLEAHFGRGLPAPADILARLPA